ncbi:hypothetical protein KDL45_16985, partial [bacterium]|nr:hypothetical protein [bacterium]
MTKANKRVAAALGMAVLFVAAVEGMLRLTGYDEPPDWVNNDGTPRPGEKYEQRNAYVDDYLSAATYNIVVVGGAWTYGLGLKTEDTYPAVLQDILLNEKSKPVRVANMASPNFTSEDTARVFPVGLARYKADLAVVWTGLTDAVPEDRRESFFARDPFSTRDDPRPSCRLCRFVSNVAWGWNRPTMPADDDESSARPTLLRYDKTQSALLAMGMAARHADVPVIFINYPTPAGQPLGHP